MMTILTPTTSPAARFGETTADLEVPFGPRERVHVVRVPHGTLVERYGDAPHARWFVLNPGALVASDERLTLHDATVHGIEVPSAFVGPMSFAALDEHPAARKAVRDMHDTARLATTMMDAGARPYNAATAKCPPSCESQPDWEWGSASRIRAQDANRSAGCLYVGTDDATYRGDDSWRCGCHVCTDR